MHFSSVWLRKLIRNSKLPETTNTFSSCNQQNINKKRFSDMILESYENETLFHISQTRSKKLKEKIYFFSQATDVYAKCKHHVCIRNYGGSWQQLTTRIQQCHCTSILCVLCIEKQRLFLVFCNNYYYCHRHS